MTVFIHDSGILILDEPTSGLDLVRNQNTDYSASADAFYSAPQNYTGKAVEVADAIKDLPASPETFRVFIIP